MLSEGIKKGEYDVLATVTTEYYEELSKADGIDLVTDKDGNFRNVSK